MLKSGKMSSKKPVPVRVRGRDPYEGGLPSEYFMMMCHNMGLISSLSKDMIFPMIVELMRMCEMNTNKVVLSSDVKARVMADLNISRVTFISLMKRLISSKVMVRMFLVDPKTLKPRLSRTEFMMNPNLVWRGSQSYYGKAMYDFIECCRVVDENCEREEDL